MTDEVLATAPELQEPSIEQLEQLLQLEEQIDNIQELLNEHMDAWQLNVSQFKLTPGTLIAKMGLLRDTRKAIAKRDKELVELWRSLEAQLISFADSMGMKRMSSDLATATVTEETLPIAEDWDEIYQYIFDNEAAHLLQRRIAAAAFRELQDAGIDVPGIRTYVQRKISLRNK